MKDLYHYTECGLDYIYLLNGYKIQQTPYGEGVSFADKLDETIADYIIREKPLLQGQDIRFLRSMMHLSQENFGKLLRVTRDAIAKIEAKPHATITGTMDALLKVQYIRYANDAGIRAMMDHIEELTEDDHFEKLLLKRKRSGEWELKEAC